MILFLSNVDTELLAMRSVVDDLPADVGGVRWVHPERIDGIPSLEDVDIVVVRLLGGRPLWSRAVRRRCRGLPGPPTCRSSPPAARLAPDARAARRVDGARRRRARGAPLPGRRRSGEPRPPGALPLRHVAAHRLRLRPARRRSPSVARLGRRRARRPRRRARSDPGPGGGRLLPRPPRRREHDVDRATCARRSRPPAPTCWPSPRTRCAPTPPGGSRPSSCAASTAST